MDGEAAQPSTSENAAFSFISRGWREVRDSTDADLRLIKSRANSFKNLASSFDRELENFFNSASNPFLVRSLRSPPPPPPVEIDFVKKLRPKISEFRRAYSAPEISKKVLERWGPRARLGIDLSARRKAIVSEAEDGDRDGIVEFDRVWRGRRRVMFREFREEEKEEGGQFRRWEPIRSLKRRLRELEKKSESLDLFEGFRSSEFVEKLKSSLKSICKEPQKSKVKCLLHSDLKSDF